MWIVLGAAACILLAGCAVPQVEVTDSGGGSPRGEVTNPGVVLYRVGIHGPLPPAIAREEAVAEASRVAGEVLGSIFEGASLAPSSVSAAAARYPEAVRKDYAPLAVILLEVEEVSAFLSWGYQVGVTLRIHDLRSWVDRHWTGYREPQGDRVPPMHLEDHASGWAERSFLSRRGDACHVIGEALLVALREMEVVLRGNPWVVDFYRLPGRRAAIADGPSLSPRAGRGEEGR